MAYQEVTTTGYGTRVGRSFKSIVTGFLLFIAATALRSEEHTSELQSR